MPKPAPAPGKPARPRRRLLLLGLGIVAVIGATAVYLAHRGKESTDDAFIEAHVVTISPQISERVDRVLVKDNEVVKKGDLLVELDPLNEQVLYETAKANLASSEAKLVQANAQAKAASADLAQARADVQQAQANADNAAKELTRSAELRKTGAIAQREYDNALAQALSTKAELSSKQQSALSSESTVKVRAAEVNAARASLDQARALLDAAKLRLSYTKIHAPESGRVTRKNVEPGSYVQTGNALLAIVPPETWVVANFKETQLTRMRPGQHVEIRVDAYPSLRLEGVVDSIQSGTGSRFSLLPAENATGNFVKVVQRLPVKIAFVNVPKNAPLLAPGMSVEPTVFVK
jgi:membrane fusion protein (multidrug efflux system)